MAAITTNTPILDGAGKLEYGFIEFAQTAQFVADGGLVTTSLGRVPVRWGQWAYGDPEIPETPTGEFVRVRTYFDGAARYTSEFWTHIGALSSYEFAELPIDVGPDGTPGPSLSNLAEIIRDTVGTTLVAGDNVTITVDDAGNTITIDATGGGSGGGTDVTIGPTPPTTGFWVDADLPTVSATAPTFTDLSGTVDDTYTIPSVANVVYKVGGVTKAAGTYAGSGTVTVTAEAATGYALSGTALWSHAFSTGATVTPAAPTSNDTTDEYTIPTTTGVDYKISGSTVAAGTYSAGNVTTTITVTAVAQSGYTLTGTTTWDLEFTAAATMWTPAGSTVLTSDSFTGSGNAESRTTDVAWGGTPVTPTTGVPGAYTVDGDFLDVSATGRLRYNVGGTGRVYIGVKIPAVPVSATALDIRYAVPSTGGTVPLIKIQRASAQDRATLSADVSGGGAFVELAAGDQVGLLVDGTDASLVHNGVVISTGVTAATGTTHGFVSFGAVADAVSDLVIAELA